MLRRRAHEVAVPLAIGLFIAVMVCKNGIPLLRHDWGLPTTSDGLGPALATLFEPWLRFGIGEPQPYPTFYLVGFILYPASVLPPSIFVGLFVAVIGAIVASGGAALCRAFNGGLAAQAACALFAALNPWTYSEFVAGHVFMVLAYGLLVWLAAEMLRERPRPVMLGALCALLVCQIEFFCVALLPVVGWLVASRQRLALMTLAIAIVPIAFGISSHYSDLKSIPYLLEWQAAQSVQLGDAVILRGYSAAYDRGFAPLSIVLWGVALCAPIAVVVAVRARLKLAIGIIGIGWLAILASTGTKSVFAPAYASIVLHVTESGVFRELYDLLAIAALAYCVSIAILASASRRAGAIALVGCATLTLAWLFAPPYAYFTPQHAIPSSTFPGTPQDRVALFPPSQPLRLDRSAAGYDPDLFIQRRAATPINTFFPSYPEISALALAERGDVRELEALGTRFIISRPYLHEGSASLGNPIADTARMPRSETLPAPFPELGLLDGRPTSASIARLASRNAIFYGDAFKRDAGAWFARVTPPRDSADPTTHWVDARLAFEAYPEVATRFGGAFTTSTTAGLRVSAAPSVLAWTSGSLKDASGNVVATHSAALKWWPLGVSRTLYCSGACAVAGVGDPQALPSEGSSQIPRPISFGWKTPWLLTGVLPAHGQSTLRLSARFEQTWMVFGVTPENHVRLAQELNAWVLPSGGASPITIVNVSAALQLLLEFASFAAIAALLITSWRAARD